MAKKKTTLNIDEELLAEAREVTGSTSDTDTVRLGLEALVRSAAYKRMATFLGSEKGRPVVDVPRRRELPAKRKVRARRSA